MNLRPALSALALVLALAACGPAAPEPTTVPAVPTEAPAAPTEAPTSVPAAPTEAPTSAPPPTAPAAPTAAPTTAPAGGVLPAPLLFVNQGYQLARLEVDGRTATPLLDEQAPIIDFALAPGGDRLAYITVDESQRSTLVRAAADGSGRTELARGIMRGVTVAADGSVQVGALFDSVAADGQPLQGGAWSFPAGDGAPELLVAATEPTADGQPGSHYQPLAWSPDGGRLLLTLTINLGPDGPGGDIGTVGLALYDAASGAARDLLPMGREPLCASPAWSRAGDAVFCANGGAIGPPTPALWRLGLADGEQETLIPAGEPLTLVLSPRELADGLYVMVGEGTTGLQRFMPQRVGPDGSPTPLLPQPIEAGFDGGLWAPDGSGVVVGRPSAGAGRVIVWQPLDSSAPVELLAGNIGELRWAVE